MVLNPSELSCFYRIMAKRKKNKPEQLRLDLSYIPRAGVVQDIALIFETLAVVIRG